MVTWSSKVLDEFIAPGISSLARADIPDIEERFPEARHWLGNYFLNSVLRGSYLPQARQVIFAYLRRTHNAFRDYHNARRSTLRYLDVHQEGKPMLREYFDVVSEWESFVLNVAMAIDLCRWINAGEGAFKRNDGSKEQRLYSMANQIKHVASCVDSGQCTDADTVPLWLSEAGLESFGVSVSFEEAASVLSDMAQVADHLQDPVAVVSARQAAREADSAGSAT